MTKGSPGCGNGQAVEHRGRVAHALGLDEVLPQTEAVLVEHRRERHPTARRLEADAAAEARRHADRAGDVGPLRDRHHACDHRGHAATGGAAGAIAPAPGRRGVAVQGALGGAGHRVLGCGRTADHVDACRFHQPAVHRVLLGHHAPAQAAAELDLAPGFVAEHVLHQERHAAKRAMAQAALVERLDAVGVGLDDGVDVRIGPLDRLRGQPRQLGRRDLAVGDASCQAQCVVAAYSCRFMWPPQAVVAPTIASMSPHEKTTSSLQAAAALAQAHEIPWPRDPAADPARWGVHHDDPPPYNRLRGPVHRARPAVGRGLAARPRARRLGRARARRPDLQRRQDLPGAAGRRGPAARACCPTCTSRWSTACPASASTTAAQPRHHLGPCC